MTHIVRRYRTPNNKVSGASPASQNWRSFGSVIRSIRLIVWTEWEGDRVNIIGGTTWEGNGQLSLSATAVTHTICMSLLSTRLLTEIIAPLATSPVILQAVSGVVPILRVTGNKGNAERRAPFKSIPKVTKKDSFFLTVPMYLTLLLNLL